jgi:lipoprotein-anchoring transpeptidase ErfK/SrfK
MVAFKRFASLNVPLYAVATIFMVTAVAAFVAVRSYRQTIENYEVVLADEATGARAFQYGSWPALENPHFFRSVRDTLVAERANFIEADLAEKRLSVYVGGAVELTVPILATGKTGSWWETPAGLYRVDGREENHFSAFSNVYMPWSLPFQGNFFIHGWPYYADGTPVESRYSGGCVRLSTDDAKRVYDLTTVGMPVLVYRTEHSADEMRYGVRPPQTGAAAYLVADAQSNFVLAERNARSIVPIASITKLITALVATEYINLDKTIVIAKNMLVPTSKPRLWPGQKVRAFDLLYPLLLESSNEAAEALAQTVGGERFVRLMNAKVDALGLKNTNFADATGASSENVSTAEDLFALLAYLRTNQSFFLKVSAGNVLRELGASPIWVGMENLNGFTAASGFVGGKIGKTETAKETMAAIFDVPVGGMSRPIAIIALGSDNVLSDIAMLRDYVGAVYEPVAAPEPMQ